MNVFKLKLKQSHITTMCLCCSVLNLLALGSELAAPLQRHIYISFLFFLSRLSLAVDFCSVGLLLQWVPSVEMATAAHGHTGIHGDLVLLPGGEDAEHLRGHAGPLRIRCVVKGRSY